LVWSGLYERMVGEFDRLRDAPMIDPRLDVWNRAALERLLEQHIAAARRLGAPLTVALLDIFGLQLINREHGLAAGDVVLQALARAIAREVRESDIVAHYRDDEFAVVCPGTAPVAAQIAIERVQARVGETA